MKVYLTGATGLIVSHVAEQLRRRGDQVVALVRESSATGHLESIGCELVVGDVADSPAALAEGMRGCDAVVHGAALVFTNRSRRDFLRLNVEGTEAVLAAAGRAAPRMVHLSSVAVYAGLPMDAPLPESRWTEADPDRQSAYAASKHLSERAAWRLHEQGVIRLTTVRPCVVYGERDRNATPVFVRAASLPVLPFPGGGRTTLPVVYAGNVARGIVAALDRPASVGRAYNLAMDTPITGRELVRGLGDALGRAPRIVPVPVGLARFAAAAFEGLTGALPGVRKRSVQRAVRSLTHDNPYDSSRARLELGWSRHTSHAEGIRRTVEWWKGRGR